MAFFSALSSSIGKKLLLFGLRHIDILDKDPADFVSVDVGKKTALEIRDVGLHVKKLVALLHLKLPPEIRPSKARASLLRVTFVLEFGVPQIIIEVDGVQVHAELVDNGDEDAESPKKKDISAHGSSPVRRTRPSSPPAHFRNDLSDDDSDDDEHVPTVDELANSFIREEPDDEIKELEQELNTQSEYLQDSITSSEYGDDESEAGMGAPLALPTYLRNILNTALDRLRIVVNHIDVEVEDHFPSDPDSATKDEEDSFVSLNFHVDRITIDSVTSQDPNVNVTDSGAASVLESSSKLGKRRMQIENIFARLKSDAVNFASMSRASRVPSPVDTRSEVSSSQKTQSEPSEGPSVEQSVEDLLPASPKSSPKPSPKLAPTPVPAQTSSLILDEEIATPTATSPVQEAKLESSVVSTDDDRFADAASEDGLDHSVMSESPVQSRHFLPSHDMSASSILYADEGMLDYAIQNDLLDSEFRERGPGDSYTDGMYKWDNGPEDSTYGQIPTGPRSTLETTNSYESRSALESRVQHESENAQQSRSALEPKSPSFTNETSTSGLLTASALTRGPEFSEQLRSPSISRSDLLTVSALGRAPDTAEKPHSVSNSRSDLLTVSALGQDPGMAEQAQKTSQSNMSERPTLATDHSDSAQDCADTGEDEFHESLHSSTASIPREEDMAESKLFTHDDAESMYMSALSAAPSSSSRSPHIPGGWDSASSSSQGTASDSSGPIPEDMISGSILEPVSEADDGCDTPRPGSRQSVISSSNAPYLPRTPKFGEQKLDRRLSKLFLTIDRITVWFPLGLEEEHSTEYTVAESIAEDSKLNFKSPNIGDDSIFQEMPGSFSNYAHSTSARRRGSSEEAARRRPNLKAQQTTRPPPSKDQAAMVNVEIGSVIGHIDLSTARIMFQLLNRVTKAFTGQQDTEKPPTKVQDESTGEKHSSITLSVKNVGFSWLERLMTESLLDGNPPQSRLQLDPLDAFVKITLASIRLKSQVLPQETRAKLQIGKFVLSSLDQDIITFQTLKSKSRRSVSTLPEHLENDVEIDYEQAKDRRVTVVTRPVKVNFDLQTLDDALSTFGGFSGILELGSSISSNNTIGSPVMSPSQHKPRGVHFRDTPAPPSTDNKPSSFPKIHLQFGEVTFVLKGKSCAVQLHTTTIRVAVRESNLRLKVSEVQLSGPYFEPSQRGAPLMVEIRGSTVNFLFTPEEVDLSKLISMITPTKDPYENDEDILIDTLLRQRRKGSVLRAEVASVGIRVSDLDQMRAFEGLGAEVARLSKVTKYLPDDDRPGILTLAMVQQLDVGVVVNERIGDLSLSLQGASLAHVGVPSLLAMEVGKATVNRGEEILLHEVIQLRAQDHLPMIMVRVVGDEMEPVVKAKFFNVCAEYRVSTIMSILGIGEDGTADEIALGLASSVATITGASSPKSLSRQASEASPPSAAAAAKPLQLDLLLRSCAVGLNPRKIPSKGLFVLTEAHISGKQAKSDYSVAVDLRKASMHAIDDIGRLEEDREPSNVAFANRHLAELHELGYISLSSISAAKVFVNISGDGKDTPQLVDVEFKNELFVIESCADSTQTLIAILNGLQPPTPPSTAERYRTVVPLQQMMESFTGDAMFAPEGEEDDNFMENADLVADEVPTNLEFVGSCYNPDSLPTDEELGDSMLGEDDLGVLTNAPVTRQRGDRGLLESFQEQYEVAEGEQEFDFNEDYFKDSDSENKGKARKWDSAKNEYHLTNEFKVPDAPLKVRVRDMNVIWNLYDGYDWPRTRGIIAQAVEDVEARAEERRRRGHDDDEDDDFVEEDFLFNSVWIGVPIKDEKGALAKRINHDIDDLVSETGSYATSTATRSTGATTRPRSSHKSGRRRLKLERSKHKKVAFSLMGVSVDLIVFPADSGETVNSIDVRVQDFEIFDHVPSSTWKKFVTCLVEPSQREMNRPMINLELLTVKPVTDLAASELVIRVTVLPLRLHVDQDALDFITRFFEFKDDAVPESTGPSEQPFIQRLEVNTVTLKLDYKPKRVDYRGLRSGHTTEFMNFLILDGSDITLRHAIVYGITSFDKLHKTLNDVWMPDVKRNQLPGVLSGLAAVRPIVNVGSGMRDLVVVPMREYKKDGRIVRSLQKGVYAFAMNTTSEVARLGAKVAIGTQNLLEGAENFLNPQNASPSRSSAHHDWDGEDPVSDSEEPRAVSHYANQPIGVRAGLRTAARHLERDLLTARDAVIAIPAEVMEEGSGVGMARAIARHAPTVILRPALGATKAVGNALLGVGNALDKESRRKIEDKYKSY